MIKAIETKTELVLSDEVFRVIMSITFRENRKLRQYSVKFQLRPITRHPTIRNLLTSYTRETPPAQLTT